MGAAEIRGPILGLTDIDKQIAAELRRAGPALIDLGMAMLEEGRIEPEQPVERIALSLARLQVMRNELSGLPAYRRKAGPVDRPGIYWIARLPDGRSKVTCDARHVVTEHSGALTLISRALLAHALSDETRRLHPDDVPADLVDAFIVENVERLDSEGGLWSRRQVCAWVASQEGA